MLQDDQPTISHLPGPVTSHTGLRGWAEKRQRNAFVLGISGVTLGLCVLCGFAAIAISVTGNTDTGKTTLILHTAVTSIATLAVTPNTTTTALAVQTTTVMIANASTPQPALQEQLTTPIPATVTVAPPTTTAIPAPPTETLIPAPPTATSVPAPPPTATLIPAPQYPAVGGNPYGYTLVNTGKLIYSPPSDICNYITCIPSFWQSTKGYVDQCSDGMFSHSGGRQGACSHHGGEQRPLFAP